MLDLKKAFLNQKGNAVQRGIEFKLTFEEWLAFWGDDIDRRGRARHDLQMQRFGDRGAYELGNIKKGTPLENARTAGLCKQARNGLAKARQHQENLDRLMGEESADPESDEDDFSHLGYASSFDRQYSFAADKDR